MGRAEVTEKSLTGNSSRVVYSKCILDFIFRESFDLKFLPFIWFW